MEFIKNVMTKGAFNTSVVVEGDEFGVVSVDEHGELSLECCDTVVGQECWVFTDIKVPDHPNGEMCLVYIPDIGYATTFLRQYVSIE